MQNVAQKANNGFPALFVLNTTSIAATRSIVHLSAESSSFLVLADCTQAQCICQAGPGLKSDQGRKGQRRERAQGVKSQKLDSRF